MGVQKTPSRKIGMCSDRLASLLALLLLSFLNHEASARMLLQKQSSETRSGFLSDEIPLTVITTLPEKIGSGGKILVSGRESITVVLSRPVIALGEAPTGSESMPFFLEPPVEGTYRWLSTYIITFQPKRDWAADLEVELQWNLNLETYDGVPLTLGAITNSRLTTPTLNLKAVNVVSNETNYLTDNYWDAFVGIHNDVLPEVPNDGYIELRASSSMKLSALRNSIKVQDDIRNTAVDVQVEVEECSTGPPMPCIDCDVEEEEEEVEEVISEPRDYSNYIYDDEFDVIVDDEPTVEVSSPVDPKMNGVVRDCANVSFSGKDGFVSGNKYVMILPSGTNYSNDAGPLKRDIRIVFGGLKEFRIPFVEDDLFNVSSPLLDIWLPHGLDPAVNITEFPMKIVRATGGADVDFSLELVRKSVLRVTASVIPGVTYKVTVFDSSSIRDGYGQKLRRSSLNFQAAPIPPLFKTMEVGSDIPYAVFEAGEEWSRKIVAFAKGSAISDQAVCKDSDSDVGLWDVDRPIEALPLFSRQTHDKSMSEYLGIQADRLVAQRRDLAGEIPEFDLEGLLKTTGIVATQYCRNEMYYPLVIVESSYQVAVLSTGALSGAGRRAVVWVTEMKTAKPVARASVNIFRKSGAADKVAEDYKVLATAKTDKNGVGIVSLAENAAELHALVQFDGKNIYVPHVEASTNIAMDISDSIILDRRLVKPGETLHIKGYVMENKDGSLVGSSLKNYRLVVSPSMTSSKRSEDVFELEDYDAAFGSYTATLRIPANVHVVPYTIRVAADAEGHTYNGRPHPFVIADPRQPPVILSVDAPHWAVPNKNLKINTVVKSFVGAAVENAELAFIWSIEDSARSAENEKLSGRIITATDKDGEASATIALSKLAVPPSAGTVMVVKVQYTSASGDFVEEVVHIRMEPADVEITLERTVHTDIPGQEFGVKATVTDLLGEPLDKDLKVNSVSLSLKEFPETDANGVPNTRPTTTDAELPGKGMQKCSIKVSAPEYCTFTIPKMRAYVVEACVSLGKRTVCKRIHVGKTKQEWQDKPLQTHLPFSIIPTTEGPYKVGDTAELVVQNPYENVRLMIAWGTTEQVNTDLVSVETGRHGFSFKVDQSCTNDCALSIVASIPRQSKSIANELDIPVNTLFDPAGPHTEFYSTVIETVKDLTLDVKISVPEVEKDNGMPLIEPGLNASVRVDFDRKGPTEITVIAVDKAVLDLLPYPLKDVSKDFVADLASYFHYKSTSEYLVAPGAIDAVKEANEARKNLDPWFNVLSNIHPSKYDEDISLSDQEYIDKYVQFLTVKPRDQEDSTTTTKPEEEEDEEGPKTANGVEEVRFVGLQASYVDTSLFNTYTASGGEYLVNFEGPKEEGEFVLRAYASSGTGLFGSSEVTVAVRKALSLSLDFPAFARLGDEFEAGVVIQTSSIVKGEVTVTIKTDEIISMSGPDVLIIDMGKQLEKEIRFEFAVQGIGSSKITIVADDGTGNAATSELTLRVHGAQEPVVIGSTFSVKASIDPKPIAKMEIPSALEGSGSIVVTAGLGLQPGVLVLADQARSDGSFTCPVEADYALAMVAIPAILDVYRPWSPDPNLLPSYMVQLINAIVIDYDQAQHYLVDVMTSSTNGLEQTHTCPGSGFAGSLGASIAQNAKGVFIVNEIEEALTEHNVQEISTNHIALLTARDSWRESLAEAAVTEAIEAKDTKAGSISLEKLALVRAALGPKWNPPKGTGASVVDDLSMNRLKKGFDSLSLEGQAYYILALLSQSKPERAEINRALSAWSQLTYTSGSRAYIVSSKKSVTPASNLANSLILFAMARAGEKGKDVERLATYVTAPISDIYGFTSFTTYEKIISMFALAEADTIEKDANMSVRLKVQSGTSTLLEHVYAPERRPAAVDSSPWQHLDENPEPIEALAFGSGEVNVAIAMKFVPRDLLKYPVYRGIFVDRTIQLDSAGEIGEGLETVPVGTVVTVKVQFMTAQDLEHTTVSVAMPAGLQPVQIGGEGTEYCPVPFFSLFSDDYYSKCPEQVTTPDEVHFLYDSVIAGSHIVSFKAVAATSGSFGLPATKVYATNSPDIMGLSSAGRFDICKPGRKCTIKTVKKTFAAKQCNENCNDNGVCDLNSGECLCFVGFSGPDCSKATV